MSQQPQQDQADPQARQPEQTVVVVGPEGMGVAGGEDGGEESPTSMVEQPAKVMRVGSMVKQLLEEVRSAPLDDAARVRLAEVHERAIHELEEGLSPELAAELRRFSLPFADESAPSDAELRVAQAQLVGWLEGLFQGIQTALVAQQMAAQAQIQQMRRALPGGQGQQGQPQPQPQPGQQPGQPQPGRPNQGTGQYL